GGLGCPNGCDFCCTSHYFKRRYIPFIKSGRKLYETMRMMERKAKEVGDCLSGFIFIDEDFFIHEKRAREFLDCVREGGVSPSIMGFGSVRGLSQFTANEIAEMGFDIIWTAFEGTRSGYKKLRGAKLDHLYHDLKSRGVAILTSMIIGFPYQDQRKVQSEFEQLMDLAPDLWQILIYFAFPGTPLYEKVFEEGLYLSAYRDRPDYRKFDGFSMHFKHEHFEPTEIEDLQQTLYRKAFETLGPSLVRVMKTWFEGYRTMKYSSRPLLRLRAERMRQYVQSALPGIYPAIRFGPNRERKAEARRLFEDIVRDFGPFTFKNRLACWGTIPLSFWTWMKENLGLFQQPGLLRRKYRL
ncbi:MAG: hypothetical protein PVI00_06825, partial [Desulfobacterales bacterium]